MTTMNHTFAAELAGLVRKDRQRRSRRRRIGEFLGNLIAAQIGVALGALLGGWLFMLAVGVAHAHWIPQLPTIGYWWSALIIWLLPTGAHRTSKSDGER
jgi:predicted MFS family arabinose efflux permease